MKLTYFHTLQFVMKWSEFKCTGDVDDVDDDDVDDVEDDDVDEWDEILFIYLFFKFTA